MLFLERTDHARDTPAPEPMKRTFGQPSQGRMTAEQAELLARKDKRRIIILAIGLLVLIGAFVTSQISAKNKKEQEQAANKNAMAVDDGPLESQIYVPEFKRMELLRNIRDSNESEQVQLKEESILAALKYTSKLTPAQYTVLGIYDLNAEMQEVIIANPASHRLDPLRVRGKILDLRHRPETDTTPGTFYGTLEQKDGSRAHFVVSDAGKMDDLPSDFLRLDGLFVQVHHAEIQGEWVNAPLLVGRRLVGSYEFLELDAELNTPAMALVEDDVATEGSKGIPYQAQWELLAKASQESGQIDWANVPKFGDEYLGRMYKGDDSLRGMAFRFPISTSMAARTVEVGENPLHRNQIMKGWIGNYTWTKGNGLIQWIGAFDNEALHDYTGKAKLVTGRGFFLKNVVYEMRDGRAGKTPLFVMQSMEIHTPKVDSTEREILWAMLGLTGVIMVIITWLLSRDKRQNRLLQQKLAERRRARLQKQQASQA